MPKALGYTRRRCCERTSARSKELYTAKEPYTTAKEPCVTIDESYITAKEPCISANERCTSSASVCTLTGCDDVWCSNAMLSVPYTSTPLPTTTVGNSRSGYVHVGISSSKDVYSHIRIYIYEYVVCVNPRFFDDIVPVYCVYAKVFIHVWSTDMCTYNRISATESHISATEPHYAPWGEVMKCLQVCVHVFYVLCVCIRICWKFFRI